MSTIMVSLDIAVSIIEDVAITTNTPSSYVDAILRNNKELLSNLGEKLSLDDLSQVKQKLTVLVVERKTKELLEIFRNIHCLTNFKEADIIAALQLKKNPIPSLTEYYNKSINLANQLIDDVISFQEKFFRYIVDNNLFYCFLHDMRHTLKGDIRFDVESKPLEEKMKEIIINNALPDSISSEKFEAWIEKMRETRNLQVEESNKDSGIQGLLQEFIKLQKTYKIKLYKEEKLLFDKNSMAQRNDDKKYILEVNKFFKDNHNIEIHVDKDVLNIAHGINLLCSQEMTLDKHYKLCNIRKIINNVNETIDNIRKNIGKEFFMLESDNIPKTMP